MQTGMPLDYPSRIGRQRE